MSILFRIIFTFALLAAGPLWGDQEVRVGATVGLNGALAKYGRHALQGLQLAVEEFNAQNGVDDKPVKLSVEDFGNLDLKSAVTATRKLLSVDKVQVLFSLIIEDSEVTIPISSKVPLFSMAIGCGARKCSSNLGKYHVRAPSSHDQIAERLVDYSVKHNVKHACIIAAEATYFDGYGRFIEELSQKAGIRVTYVSVPFAIGDFRDVAARFKHENCDAIYPWITHGSIGGFYRRLSEIGYQAIRFGIVETDSLDILESAGSAAEGVVYARFAPGNTDFQQRYKLRFHEEPMRPAAPAYDGVKLVLELIKKVGTDPNALRDEIVKIKDRPAVNGIMTYNQEGERTGEDVQLMRISNGIPTEVKE